MSETIFTPILAPIEPEPLRTMIEGKLNEALAIVRENNKRVAAVNAAKKSDPNDPEVQDNAWKRVVAEQSDPDIVASEKRYQKALAAMEKEIAFLRTTAKEKHIQPPMSEDDVQKTRKLINDGKSVIHDTLVGARSTAAMADQMLELVGKPVEGGVMSIMPEADSLMNARGRKPSGNESKGSGEGYATRLIEAFVDGKSTNKEVKRKGVMVNAAHFNYVGETLSRRFNEGKFPGNQVTAQEVEEAYYASRDVTFRDSASMPEVCEFDFTKEIEVQNPNDDSTKREPHTVKIKVIRWTKETAGITDKDNEESAEGENKESEKPSA